MSRLRDLLSERAAIRTQIDKSRESIGLEPLAKQKIISDGSVALAPRVNHPSLRSTEEALAYGRALSTYEFRHKLNLKHARAGLHQLFEPPQIPPVSGCSLYKQVRAGVVVDTLCSGGKDISDEQIHHLTMARLLEKNARASRMSKPRRRQQPHAVKFTHVKFLGNGRQISGFASTSDIDLMGDVLDPRGMITRLPIPLLFGHDHQKPVGTVTAATVKDNGIWIESSLVDGIQVADDALKLIAARSIDAFSVGFIPLEWDAIATGFRFTKWRMTEVSIVPVPANPSARIQRDVSGGAVRLVR